LPPDFAAGGMAYIGGVSVTPYGAVGAGGVPPIIVGAIGG